MEGYNHDRGLVLGTYARHWVTAYICREVRENHSIRRTSHAVDRNVKITRAREALKYELGRSPTDEEIAKASGFNLKHVRMDQQFALTRVTPLDASHEATIENMDPSAQSILEATEREMVAWRLLATLDSRDFQVMDVDVPGTDMGESLGISRERVRQLRERASNELRREHQGIESMAPRPSLAVTTIRQRTPKPRRVRTRTRRPSP